MQTADLALAVVLGVVALIFFLYLCIMGKRINFALDIVIEAGKVITRIPTLWLLPLFLLILSLAVSAAILVTLFFIWASGEF